MHGGRSRHSSPRFFQDALSYLVIFLLSFLKFIKTVFSSLVHPESSHGHIPVYPSLRTESVASSCTLDFVLDFHPGALDIRGHPYEIHETSGDSLDIVPNLVSPTSPSRYKPLQLTPVLHDFPAKYYKYLPKFNGESKNLTAEKHVQALWAFLWSIRDRTWRFLHADIHSILARGCQSLV